VFLNNRPPYRPRARPRLHPCFTHRTIAIGAIKKTALMGDSSIKSKTMKTRTTNSKRLGRSLVMDAEVEDALGRKVNRPENPILIFLCFLCFLLFKFSLFPFVSLALTTNRPRVDYLCLMNR
jgi:hypothetical protein